MDPAFVRFARSVGEKFTLPKGAFESRPRYLLISESKEISMRFMEFRSLIILLRSARSLESSGYMARSVVNLDFNEASKTERPPL